jgi:uncharacterized repeat protein (TIGR01451 family)
LGATGNLSNTATVSPPPGVIDPDGTDNSATDIDNLVVGADLAVTKSARHSAVTSGDPVFYTLAVTNLGPSPASGARVVDVFPAGLANVTWTCQASPGATCPAPSGIGNIDAMVGIPAGGQVVFAARADVVAAPPALIANTVTVTAATDPNAGNNSSRADVLVVAPIFSDGFESGDIAAWSAVVGQTP